MTVNLYRRIGDNFHLINERGDPLKQIKCLTIVYSYDPLEDAPYQYHLDKIGDYEDVRYWFDKVQKIFINNKAEVLVNQMHLISENPTDPWPEEKVNKCITSSTGITDFMGFLESLEVKCG